MNTLSELTCMKCNEVFNLTTHIPRLLAECGHTLCTLCIKDLTTKSMVFKCPDDGILCGISKKAPEEFPKNLSLIRVIERQSANKENVNLCAIHNKRLEIVCIDCKKRLCSKCALFEGHRVHELRPEEDVYSEIMLRKELLQDMLEMVNDSHELISHKNKLEDAYEKCEAKEEEFKNKIEKKFNECISLLNEKKTQALQSLKNISTSIKERIRELQSFSKDLPNLVNDWKTEVTKKLNNKDWTEALSLIESKADSSNNFLHTGKEILEVLTRVKANYLNLNIEETIQEWFVTFNENIKRYIEEYCVVKSPLDTYGTVPRIEFYENIEDIFPIKLEDSNLLNESGSFYENYSLANLSPNKRLSLTRSTVEKHSKYSARLSLVS